MHDKTQLSVVAGTILMILFVLLIALVLLAIVYRRRKLRYLWEMEAMKEKYQKEMLETEVEIQRNIMQQMGREIHDNVGQKLTLATLYTEHLKLGATPELISEKIYNIAALINESLADLRNLSQYLINPSNEEAGLASLIQKEIVKVTDTGICNIHFEITGDSLDYSPHINNMILRITQEFLQNSIKHAECKNIYINLSYGDKDTQLELEDDGKGFVAHDTVTSNGIGIKNIKNRAALINAVCMLKSNPGLGTQLQLFIPAKIADL